MRCQNNIPNPIIKWCTKTQLKNYKYQLIFPKYATNMSSLPVLCQEEKPCWSLSYMNNCQHSSSQHPPSLAAQQCQHTHNTPLHQLRHTHVTPHPCDVLLLHPPPGRQCSQPLTCQAQPPSTLGWSPRWWGGGPPDGTPACHPGQCCTGPPCPSARWRHSRHGGGKQHAWASPWHVGHHLQATRPSLQCFSYTARTEETERDELPYWCMAKIYLSEPIYLNTSWKLHEATETRHHTLTHTPFTLLVPLTTGGQRQSHRKLYHIPGPQQLHCCPHTSTPKPTSIHWSTPDPPLQHCSHTSTLKPASMHWSTPAPSKVSSLPSHTYVNGKINLQATQLDFLYIKVHYCLGF